MKLKFYIILCLLFSMKVTAQQVIANAGEFWNNSEGSLSWTIGEVVTETVTTASYQLTQGFQQIQEGYLVLSDNLFLNDITIFPNPFSSEVKIQTNYEHAVFDLIVFDYQNKIVYQNEILFSPACEQLTIDLSVLDAGYYYFELTTPLENKRFIQRLIKLKDD